MKRCHFSEEHLEKMIACYHSMEFTNQGQKENILCRTSYFRDKSWQQKFFVQQFYISKYHWDPTYESVLKPKKNINTCKATYSLVYDHLN